MFSDLRFVVRALVRNRAFSLVTILTLALGIGAAASIFSVTDWVLFRANQYPTGIYLIGATTPEQPFMPIQYDFQIRGYEGQTDAVEEFAKASYKSGNVVPDTEPVRTGWLAVTPNLMPMLGMRVELGRGFLLGEDVSGSDQVVVVSHGFWRKELGGRPEAVGRKIIMGDAVCTVVGVLAEQTIPPHLWNDLYRPLTYQVDPAKPWETYFYLLGRLREGVTREQATAILAAAKIEAPESMRQWLSTQKVALSSLAELNQAFHPETYWVLVGAVGLLYAIACLNASNLMLVRMLGQRRELSIRLALGGGRWRVIRVLALESVTLALVAGLLGALLANWIFPLLLSAAGGGGSAPDWKTWNLGARVLGVLGGLSVLTSLVVTTVPALRILRAEIYDGLKEGGAALGESPAVARLRATFVILQTAFAVILLTGAGLMIRTFHNLQKVELGFDPAGRAKLHLMLPPNSPTDWQPWLARMGEIEAQLLRVPGVRAVGFGSDVLLPGYYYTSMELLDPEGRPVKAALGGFSLGFNEAAGLKLRSGRWLKNVRGNEVMVNETLARTCWPGQNAVGQLLRSARPNPDGGKDWKGWEVVGVVADVRSSMREAPKNYVYGPVSWTRGSTFVVRLAGDYSETLAGSIKRSLYAFDPRIVVMTQPLSQARDQQIWAEQMANSVLKVLAGIALLLTVVGVFSVLAYTVDRRMGEFGVRMALGATRGDLLRLVMTRGVLLAFAGIVVGIGAALALGRSLQSLLFDVSPQSGLVLAAVGFLLLATSALGCLVPALRATKVDVTKLLRSE